MIDGPDLDNPDEFGLVMPFVVCASAGGPYDDDAYIAGYEAGLLDARLADENLDYFIDPMPYHADNIPQLDLVAMRHGYTARSSDAGGDWVYLRFDRTHEI